MSPKLVYIKDQTNILTNHKLAKTIREINKSLL